jgi:glycosyltransferase involved in cell wall biosynthesis
LASHHYFKSRRKFIAVEEWRYQIVDQVNVNHYLGIVEKVLIITDVDFWQQGAGHRMRIANLIRYIRDYVDLTVVFVGTLAIDEEQRIKDSLKGNFINLDSGNNPSMEEIGMQLNQLVANQIFSTVIIEYIHNTYFLKYLNLDNTQVVLDAHDIISDRTEDFRKYNYQSQIFEMPKDIEFQLFDIYDYILVLCEPDLLKINSELGEDKALLCPHPVPVSQRKIRDEVKRISFVASEYIPNIDAINFFISECWPAIFRENTQVMLTIYGNVGKKITITPNQNIVIKGYVADLNEVYEESDIIINPVRFGAGLKIKNVEALANGLPLITTSHGARGLEKGVGEAFLIADTSVEFINHLQQLILNRDLRYQLGANASLFVNEYFSVVRCFEPLLNIIT